MSENEGLFKVIRPHRVANWLHGVLIFTIIILYS